MGITLETGFTNELKQRFIDEIVVLQSFKELTTSTTVQKNKVNIKMETHSDLLEIIELINKSNLKVTINSDEDNIIVIN